MDDDDDEVAIYMLCVGTLCAYAILFIYAFGDSLWSGRDEKVFCCAERVVFCCKHKAKSWINSAV